MSLCLCVSVAKKEAPKDGGPTRTIDVNGFGCGFAALRYGAEPPWRLLGIPENELGSLVSFG